MTLRKTIFWMHLVAGVIAGSVIFVMSFTGAVLAFEPQITAFAERAQRFTLSAPGNRLDLNTLVEDADAAFPGKAPSGVTLQSDPSAAVVVAFGRDGTAYIDPFNGAILGKGSWVHGFLHKVEDWHRWLGSRDIGKPIADACNVAFFFLAVSGFYLWGPFRWSRHKIRAALFFNRGWTGRLRDWNWHNVIGFWSSPVLIILTLTGTVMSYAWANRLVYRIGGGEAPIQSARPENRAPRQEAPLLLPPLGTIFNNAVAKAPKWTSLTLRFPQKPGAPVTAFILEKTAPHPYARSQASFDATTGEVKKWEPYARADGGKKLRLWVRASHTGEAAGLPGQIVAFLASVGGVVLVWTGFAMAWRRFLKWQKKKKILRRLR